MPESHDNRVRSQRLPIATAIVGAVGCVGAYIYCFHDHPFGGPGDWASFGDYLGGVLNPAFSLVAVIVALRALAAQNRELKVQADESRATREALSEQLAIARLESLRARASSEFSMAMRMVDAFEANYGKKRFGHGLKSGADHIDAREAMNQWLSGRNDSAHIAERVFGDSLRLCEAVAAFYRDCSDPHTRRVIRARLLSDPDRVLERALERLRPEVHMILTADECTQ